MKNLKPKMKLIKLSNFTKKFIITCICLSLVILGTLIGSALTNKKIDQYLDVNKKHEEIYVLPNTEVCIIKKYSCGHTETYKTNEYVGYTKLMLESIENCKVKKMTSKCVELTIESNEYCSKHYVLMLVKENVLCVFSTDSIKYGNEQIMEINMDVSMIANEEYDNLRHGILFDSLEEINSYIENIET